MPQSSFYNSDANVMSRVRHLNKKQTRALQQDAAQMEDKLNELKFALSSDQKESTTHWKKGAAGTTVKKSKLTPGEKLDPSKFQRVKMLTNATEEPPERKTGPGTVSHIANRTIPEKFQPSFSDNKKPCGQCEIKAATLKCIDCKELYCDHCFSAFHIRGALKSHEATSLLEQAKISDRFEALPAPDQSVNNNDKINQGGGALLQGEFDEKESAQSFQEALKAWRASPAKPTPSAAAPSKPVQVQRPPLPTNSTATSTVPMERVPSRSNTPLEIKFTSSLSYAERLLLKKHAQKPSAGITSVSPNRLPAKNRLDRLSNESNKSDFNDELLGTSDEAPNGLGADAKFCDRLNYYNLDSRLSHISGRDTATSRLEDYGLEMQFESSTAHEVTVKPVFAETAKKPTIESLNYDHGNNVADVEGIENNGSKTYRVQARSGAEQRAESMANHPPDGNDAATQAQNKTAKKKRKNRKRKTAAQKRPQTATNATGSKSSNDSETRSRTAVPQHRHQLSPQQRPLSALAKKLPFHIEYDSALGTYFGGVSPTVGDNVTDAAETTRLDPNSLLVRTNNQWKPHESVAPSSNEDVHLEVRGSPAPQPPQGPAPENRRPRSGFLGFTSRTKQLKRSNREEVTYGSFTAEEVEENEQETLDQLEWELASMSGRLTADGRISQMELPGENEPLSDEEYTPRNDQHNQLQTNLILNSEEFMDDFEEVEAELMREEVKSLMK